MCPATTLLFPYFEVDLDNVNGTTTVINITNASATAILAHVTIWSDLGVPLLQFDNYLTGYDVVSLNLRDILVNGTFPQDASAGQDPSDQRSPQGQFSQDINFASCTGSLPKPPLPAQWQPPDDHVALLQLDRVDPEGAHRQGVDATDVARPELPHQLRGA